MSADGFFPVVDESAVEDKNDFVFVDAMLIEPIETPLLVVTSSNCGLFSMMTVNIRSMYSRNRSLIDN